MIPTYGAASGTVPSVLPVRSNQVILAEGEYSVVARNEDKTYNGKFKVEPGFDREIEVMAR